MNTIRLNIAIRPSVELEKYIYESVKELGKYGEMLFELDGVNYFPHATIYSPEFPENAQVKIFELLESFCKDYHYFSSKFTALEVEDGYIVSDFVVNEEVVNLHKAIVSLLNPLRNGVLRPKYLDPTYLNTLPEKKRNNILTYGYPGVMEDYKPHFTLTRYRESHLADEVIKSFKWDFEKVDIKRIGVFVMGDNGTCVRLLREFELT